MTSRNLDINIIPIQVAVNKLDEAISSLEANRVAAISDVPGLQAALDLKAPLASPTFSGTVSGVTKSMVGLGSVDNTSDANKPISSATQTALDLKAPLASPTFTGTVSGVTKSMVGLGSVDNTADTAKPVSTAQQTALNLKADLASPTFTGTVAGISKSMVGLGSVDNTADTAKPVSTAQQTALDAKQALPRARAKVRMTSQAVTYSQNGNGNITVTLTAHGLQIGDLCNFTISTGTGASGNLYPIITITDANTFVCSSANANTTSGNATLNNVLYNGGINVANLNDTGTGGIRFNFTSNLADAHYVPNLTFLRTAAGAALGVRSIATLSNSILSIVVGDSSAAVDADYVSLEIW